MQIIGIMDSKVEIAGKLIPAEFLVVKGITTGCIIGANTMAKEKMTIDVAAKKVIIPGLKTRPGTTPTRITLQPRTETLVKIRTGQERGVRLIEEKKLPPEISLNSAVYRLEDKYQTIVVSNTSDRPIELELSLIHI